MENKTLRKPEWETTYEQNSVIARFLGYFQEDERGSWYKIDYPAQYLICGKHELKFHQDLNELIPAFKKVRDAIFMMYTGKDGGKAVYDEMNTAATRLDPEAMYGLILIGIDYLNSTYHTLGPEHKKLVNKFLPKKYLPQLKGDTHEWKAGDVMMDGDGQHYLICEFKQEE